MTTDAVLVDENSEEKSLHKIDFFAYEINLKGERIGDKKLLGSYEDSENAARHIED